MEIGALGWLGILLGAASVVLISGRDSGTGRIALVFLLAVVQVAVAIFFYQWAQTNTNDAANYYYDPYDFYVRGFGLSTQFVIWLVQSIKLTFGGSYLDFFLLFQATGTWGLVFLMKTFEELFAEARQDLPWQAVAVLFLPGLHFWTAYIGKDGPLFLAAAMTVWAALNIGSRWVTFAIAITIMILFRPHIALLAMAAVAIAIVIDNRTAFTVRVALSLFALVGLAVTMATVRSTFAIDVTSADSVSDFLASRDQAMQGDAGGTSEVSGSFLYRMFSLLFRPLFFDASGALGLVASLENLMLLLIAGRLVASFRTVAALFRQLLVFRYAALFALMLTILLSMFYYNVGLGLRQKMMMMPAILTMFAFVVASSRYRRRQLVPKAQPA